MGRRRTYNDFVLESRKIHGNKYDYSNVEYVNSYTKVCIICPVHGEFWQRPQDHIDKKQGCPKCSFDNRKLTQDEFISKAKEVHGNRYDYSKVEYKGNKIKVCVICPIHGEFMVRPDIHLGGFNCKKCQLESQKRLLYGVAYNDLIEETNTQAYKIWKHVLSRCCSETFKKKHPTYYDCTICEEWLTFSNFKRWFDENYIVGWDIDKDVITKGNKVYSPQTCCFLPTEINRALGLSRNARGNNPIGVRNFRNHYKVNIILHNKSTHIGVFKTKEEAFYAYKQAKESYIKSLADKYKTKLKSDAYNALMNLTIEITD